MLGLKIGIDFGSSNLTIYVEGRGIVMREPSVMICDSYSGKPLALGSSAKKMCEKLPASMKAVYPIKDGIVGDRENACLMLRSYINKICAGKLFKPNVLMCVPSTVTTLQKKTIFDVVTSSGAGRACFVDEALASAIGAGVSMTKPQGVMVCDIGAGITDCSVVTMGNIALSESAEVGGNVLSSLIYNHMLHEHRIEIGPGTAEEIKKIAGTAVLRDEEIAVIGQGKNIDTGIPVEFEITADQVYEILRPKLQEILDCIINVLEVTPPELSGDIAENGIILTGGTAMLYGLDKFIENGTHLKTVVASNPEECSAYGIGRLLKDMDYLDRNGYIFKQGNNEEDESGE